MANSPKSPTCRICGKPLSDPLSVQRGIGPECYQGYKLKEYGDKTGNVFANRSEYRWGIDGNVLWIEDLNGPKSVTNDMDNVLIDIAEDLREKINGLRIMYRDSMGTWDGVTARFTVCEALGTFRHNSRGADVGSVNFFSLNEKEYEPAKTKLLSKPSPDSSTLSSTSFFS